MSGYRSFEIEGYTGELSEAQAPVDLASSVERLVDPGHARDTIHWGRNYLYSATLDTVDGPLEVVVKQFRNRGLRARWRRRLEGSKAEKHWRIARALEAAGVPTPPLLLRIESTDPEGPSFLVTRRLDGAVEARYFLRAVHRGRQESEFPGMRIEAFLDGMGRLLRRMHDAGIWHRDVSVGNLLLRVDDGELRFWVLDLNRAREIPRVGVVQRTRDLCRLRIFDPAQQRRFQAAYWADRGGAAWAKRALYWLFHKSFLWRNEIKKVIRAPFTGLWPRTAHAHIPMAPEGASTRDRVVWDRLSDQPHQHAGRLARLRIRLADAGAHAREGAALVTAAPRIWRRYRRLAGSRHASPRPWSGVGVAVRPWPEDPAALLAAIDELGARRIYLRLDTWSEEVRDAEEALARGLSERGYELAFGIPQNRDLVRQPARWDAAVEEIGRRFAPYGRDYQVGQAINRSKWGVWKSDEYRDLLARAAPLLRRWRPDARLLGPAVIDFEVYATAAIVNLPWVEARLDVLASLLYVDRRGAPENRQLGFDTVGKVTLLKAIAETARNCGPESWITEVNWPLREGPHAPAGRAVAVDEETQADYLARFYLLSLGTGLVERVYWWQLVSRGYGLVCPEADGTLRRRRAFAALRTLEQHLAGATFHGPQPTSKGVHAYRFTLAGGRERWAVWSAVGPREVELPAPVVHARDRDGEPVALEGRARVEATGSVLWVDL